MPRVHIARIDEVPPGAARFFCREGHSVLIAHCEGRIYALDGICPHKGFELEGARIFGDRIECPWHGYQYDLRSGENVFPTRVYVGDIARPADPIATYTVEIAGDEIWVELP